MTALRIGLVGAVHPNMPGDDIGLYRSVAVKLAELSKQESFELVSVSEPLRSETDGRSAVEFLNDRSVDFTLFFNASLPYGRVILPFAELESRIGLWSVAEPTTDGVLQLNSFCGLNMIGSILANYVDRERVRYKWFYGAPESPMFRERFSVTLGALRAMKVLAESRIGQIGDLADGFENMYVDERVLRKRFGTELYTRHTVEDVVRRAERYSDHDIQETLDAVLGYGRWNKVRVTSDQLHRVVRVNKALEEIAQENDYDALAISCWSKFQEVYGVAVCGAMSRLNEKGIVAPCEADVTSAVAMLMLNAVSGKPSTVNDMVALDESDASINLWHCGVAAKSWANDRGVVLDAHFNIGEYAGDQWQGKGVVVDMTFKPGKVTIFNLRNDFDHFFIVTGDMMENKKGFAGSSGWVSNLRMNGNAISLPDLINTIVTRRVNHHYPTGWGDAEAELREIAFWSGSSVIDPVPYRTYMEALV